MNYPYQLCTQYQKTKKKTDLRPSFEPSDVTASPCLALRARPISSDDIGMGIKCKVLLARELRGQGRESQLRIPRIGHEVVKQSSSHIAVYV